MTLIYGYIDFIWLPIALLALHRYQWPFALGFFLSCFLVMRLQIDVMESIDYPRGILGLLDMDLFQRGLITYSIFYTLYILLSYLSPGSRKVVFMAATISLFFSALFVSTLVMVL